MGFAHWTRTIAPVSRERRSLLSWLADLAVVDLAPEPDGFAPPALPVDRCIAAARAHGLLPQLAYAASQGAWPGSEEPRLAKLRDQFVQHELAMSVVLTDLATGFAGAGIPCIVLKGLPLARRRYRGPALRVSEDIDLLVKREHLGAARSVLGHKGYARIDVARDGADDYHETWAAPRRRVAGIVELHWDVTRPSSPVRFDLDRFWDSVVATDLPGPVPRPSRLSDEEELAYLCWHALSAGVARLRDLSDVARSAGAIGPRGLEAAQHAARRAGALRHLHLALCWAHALWPRISPPCPIEDRPIRSRPRWLTIGLTEVWRAMADGLDPFWAVGRLRASLLEPGSFRWRQTIARAARSTRRSRGRSRSVSSGLLTAKVGGTMLLTAASVATAARLCRLNRARPEPIEAQRDGEEGGIRQRGPG